MDLEGLRIGRSRLESAPWYWWTARGYRCGRGLPPACDGCWLAGASRDLVPDRWCCAPGSLKDRPSSKTESEREETRTRGHQTHRRPAVYSGQLLLSVKEFCSYSILWFYLYLGCPFLVGFSLLCSLFFTRLCWWFCFITFMRTILRSCWNKIFLTFTFLTWL